VLVLILLHLCCITGPKLPVTVVGEAICVDLVII
jgi:hypothetical protein